MRFRTSSYDELLTDVPLISSRTIFGLIVEGRLGSITAATATPLFASFDAPRCRSLRPSFPAATHVCSVRLTPPCTTPAIAPSSDAGAAEGTDAAEGTGAGSAAATGFASCLAGDGGQSTSCLAGDLAAGVAAGLDTGLGTGTWTKPSPCNHDE